MLAPLLAASGLGSPSRAFAEWLTRVVLPTRAPGAKLPPVRDLVEAQVMLEQNSKDWSVQWRSEGRREGRREGLQEGLQQGELAVITRQLQRRFGPLSEDVHRRLANASADMLLVWAERLLTAQRIEDVID